MKNGKISKAILEMFIKCAQDYDKAHKKYSSTYPRYGSKNYFDPVLYDKIFL